MKIQKIMNNCIIMILLLGIFYGSKSRGETGRSLEAGLKLEQEKLENEKEKFKTAWDSDNLFFPETRGVILARCNDNWADAVQNIESRDLLKPHYKNCANQLSDEAYKANSLFSEFGLSPNATVANHKKLFKEHDMEALSQHFRSINDKESLINNNYCVHSPRGGPKCKNFVAVFRQGNIIAALEQESFQAFLRDRESLMTFYGCDPSTNLVKCSIPDPDKNCMEKAGFKNCRPFLKGGCNKDAVLALESELSQEDKTGMTYICWKAATQGAQCCMNPDQCPTDGAFRSISSQLQKAAPGMVQAFAGLEAIKGDYQKACEMSLMANAAGPLAQLKTKTCGDSASACEETCDKAVQDFKENFKQAVMGQQRQRKEEKPLTIDEIVNAAKAIEKGDSVSEEKIAKEDVTTCSQAVVYLDNLFKDRKENKKIRSLSEKLSHASLVDCSGEVFKHSSGGGPPGGASPGVPGMNPMAAQMCRQGNPNGPGPPRLPVVGPTPNPRMGQNYFTGGKTTPGPGGDFVAPGTPGAPPDEFIEPPRGPAGANALQGGWTDTGGGSSPGGSGGPGGGGLTGSPSRDEEGGNGGTGDNLPMAYPEGFDMGSGGLDSGGGDLSAEDAERLRMAEYMKEKDKEEELKKEEERLKEIDAQGSIFNRISQTIQAWCEKENCSEE